MKHFVSISVAKRLYDIGIDSELIDEIIDEFRRKFNIIIYNTADPYVSPSNKGHKIVFAYTIKQCFPGKQLGWNGRKLIGATTWSSNIYDVKRKAILIALKYVEKRPISNNRRKRIPYYGKL